MSQKDITVRPWKLLSSTTALDEKWFPVRKDTVQLPSGKIIDDYFVWEAPVIVSVVPVTAEGKFVVVEQYRHAIGKVMFQFPAGAVDKGESDADAAARELKEETGYTCDKLVPLGTLAPYCTKMTGTNITYIALNARQVGKPKYDEQEESKPYEKTQEEIFALLESGETNPMLLAADFLLALRYLKKI